VIVDAILYGSIAAVYSGDTEAYSYIWNMNATIVAVCSYEWLQVVKTFQDNLLTTLKMKLNLHVGEAGYCYQQLYSTLKGMDAQGNCNSISLSIKLP
jgi:hypothetical protein